MYKNDRDHKDSRHVVTAAKLYTQNQAIKKS